MSSNLKERDGPYVASAVLCDRVLTERSGAFSPINIVDRLTLNPPPGVVVPELLPPLDVTIFVLLRSGGARGRHTLRLRAETPSGQKLPEITVPAHFEGDGDRGAAFIFRPLPWRLGGEGLYWIDVLLGERMLTRIPFRVVLNSVGHAA